MSRHRFRSSALVVGCAAAALLLGACGDGDRAKTVTVTATDFGFDGLPRSIATGTSLRLTNASQTEVHELVAVRLPDSERRSSAELSRLPPDQLLALFSGPPALVLVAPPGGGPQIVAEGDGTLKETGRYLMLCTVPTGAEPQAFLEAGPGGPKDVSGGPPHFVHGMHAELIVK